MCPRQDSNLRTRLRRPALYPLSYGGERSESSNAAGRPPRRDYPRHVPRVLLVDDDPVILRLLEVNFRLEGFDTSKASNGPDALRMAAAEQPDCVILDVMLPGMDGHAIYEQMHGDPSLARVPVVFLSARAMDDDVDRYASADVDYVTKPFDPLALVEVVRSRIEASG
jgi:CheY-like chemotaxis protein